MINYEYIWIKNAGDFFMKRKRELLSHIEWNIAKLLDSCALLY